MCHVKRKSIMKDCFNTNNLPGLTLDLPDLTWYLHTLTWDLPALTWDLHSLTWDNIIPQSLQNTIIAPLWLFRLTGLLCQHKCTKLLTYLALPGTYQPYSGTFPALQWDLVGPTWPYSGTCLALQWDLVGPTQPYSTWDPPGLTVVPTRPYTVTGLALQWDLPSLMATSHRWHRQDKTVLSCLVGGVNWIGDKSRLSATEKFETVLSSLEMRCELTLV